MNPHKLRAVIYARYSTDKQRKDSIEDQARLCKDYIRDQGWELVEVYADPKLKGGNAFRPEYQAMIADAAAGKFDVVVSEAVDRLSRRLADLSDMFDRLEIDGIKIYVPGLGELNRMHVSFMGYQAQMYSSELAKKVKRGQVGRVVNGKVAAGHAYGYKVLPPVQDGKTQVAGEREIIPEEAEVVRRIFTEYAAGISPEAIARSLNQEGIPGPRGKEWRNTTIRGQRKRATGILRNHLYIGKLAWNKCSYVTIPGTDTRQARPNPPEKWVYGDAPHLRVIDEDLWENVRNRMDAIYAKTTDKVRSVNNYAPGRNNNLNASHRPQYLLAGLMKCGECGANYTMVGKDRYGCANRNRGTATCSNSKTIKRQLVEERILFGLKEQLMEPERVRIFVAKLQREVKAAQKSKHSAERRLRKELADAEGAIENLMTMIESGDAPASILDRLKEREQEKATIAAKLANESIEEDVIAILPNLHEVYARKVADLINTLNSPDVKAQATDTIRRLIEKIDMVKDDHAPHGMTLVIHGDLARIMAFCEGAKHNEKLPGSFEPGSQSSVVAGVGFEPTTFRL